MAKKRIVEVEGQKVQLFKYQKEDYISLTDMVKGFEGKQQLIYNWMRNRQTLEFLGVWETMNNVNFNSVEFDRFRMSAGLNTFTMSPKKWIEATNAIGIISKSGRYGGTYAHEDIALEFGSALSPQFKLYLLREFKRLKQAESKQLEWNVRRILSKVNYKIHTDAVKQNLIPERIVTTKAVGLYYASEADVLNIAVFGLTAKQWKLQNPESKGNMRDGATTEQLLILANIESLNAEYIKEGLPQTERVKRLNEVAIYQMRLLLDNQKLEQLF